MSLKQLENDFVNHCSIMDRKMDTIEDTQKGIKSSLKHIETNDLLHLKNDLIEVKTNVGWLIKSHWIVVTAAVGAFFGAIGSILLLIYK